MIIFGMKSPNLLDFNPIVNSSKFTNQQLKKESVKNVDLLIGDFSEVIKTLDNESFDLIFIDGNHDKNATIDYFEQLLSKTHNESVIIFDDINWSEGMKEAWETIVSHEQVTVSIDTFFWGIVFLRKEQAKEHFVIRI